MRRPKAVILLQALYDGQTVELDGTTYAMSEEDFICWVPKVGLDAGKGIIIDLSVKEFIKMADKLTDDEIAAVAMNNALNRIQELKVEAREKKDEAREKTRVKLAD
jgi:hypothetical protein